MLPIARPPPLRRGNLLKLDRHKYVKVAYHGLTKLEPDERKALYAQQFETQPSFTPPEYASVDTEFLLVDVCLFCQLVDLKDRTGEIQQTYAKSEPRHAQTRIRRGRESACAVGRARSCHVVAVQLP